MEPIRNSNPLVFTHEDGEQERRRHGRLLCEDLRCNLGKILDLSASGMRVFRKGGAVAKVGDKIHLVIEYLDASMKVGVVTVRADKVGFRKHMYGFQFIDLTDQQKTRLAALARIASDTLTLARKNQQD